MTGPTYENPIMYRKCRIIPAYTVFGWMWSWQHDDLDVGDTRFGHERTIEGCIEAIDDKLSE